MLAKTIHTWKEFIKFRQECSQQFGYGVNGDKIYCWLDFQPKYKWVEVKTAKKGEKEWMNVLIPFTIEGFGFRKERNQPYLYLTLTVKYQED